MITVLGESKSGQGKVLKIDESPEERKTRLQGAFDEAGVRFNVTDGQRKVLRRAFLAVQE